MRHLEAVSCRWSASQPHHRGAMCGAPGSPEPPRPGPLTHREATPPLRYVSFSASLRGARRPSLRPCNVHGGGGVAVMSHPSICLAAGPATQTPVSRVSPEPCLCIPSMWSLCGPGLGPGLAPSGWTAGAWSWNRPQPQGTGRRGVDGTGGGGSHPRLSRGPAGDVPENEGRGRPRKPWPAELGALRLPSRGPGRGASREATSTSAPDPSPAPQAHIFARPSA